EITENHGKSYEILLTTYTPFACGVVIHPAIDACIQLRREHTLTADQIARIDLRVHPLVLELTGKKAPQTGLESKFSVYFAAALAIVKGSAGMRDFSDANAKPRDCRAAGPGVGDDRPCDERGSGARRHHPERRPDDRVVRRARGREHRAA